MLTPNVRRRMRPYRQGEAEMFNSSGYEHGVMPSRAAQKNISRNFESGYLQDVF